MAIPPELQSHIDRLNQELDFIEPRISNGLNILRRVLSRFPENVILVQYFAYLNTISLFVGTSRQQIQTIIDTLTADVVSMDIIQEGRKDLGILIGRVIEAKIRVNYICIFLESLPWKSFLMKKFSLKC